MRWSAAMILVLILASGCPLSRQAHMEEVAKDWAMTIRASQVLPVYPITEDLEPGDVFIVTTPLTAQRNEWNDRGYMRLPSHVARLEGLNYAGFYRGSFGTEKDEHVPHWWRQKLETPRLGAREGDKKGNGTNWPDAPRAFFPTYTFETETGAGLAAAFPIYGVPIGISLMGAKRASGSVTIRDAYTYGVSLNELRPALHRWLADPATDSLLKALKKNTKEAYVRIVNRVFLAGSVAIGLTNQDSFGAGFDVGVPKTVSNPFVDSGDAKAYAEKLALLNSSLDSALPGGSLKITHASNRSVTAIEQFDRPLVIGYLAFDFKVTENGKLMEAMATLNMLELDEIAHGDWTGPTPKQVENAAYIAAYTKGYDALALGVFDKVATLMGTEFETSYKAFKVEALKKVGTTPLAAARSAFQDAFDKMSHKISDFDTRLNEAFKTAVTPG